MSDLKDKSIEELLELAEECSTEEEEKVVTKKHVLDFITEYGIIPGTTLVPTSVIFYEYLRVWRPESRSKITKIDFFRNFSKHFEQKRKNKGRYYLLNEGIFTTSKEHLDFIKGLDKRYEKKASKQSKENKKK